MTHVTVHGELAILLGKSEWEFELGTPNEVFMALEANTGKLIRHMFANPESEYRILIDDQDLLVADELLCTRPMQHIHLMPVLAGAGGAGGWLALIGLVIIAAVVVIASSGAATPGVVGFFSSLSTFQAFALTVGVTVALSGISQMLMKSPKNDKAERPENKPSYIFSGAINSYRQGNPVAVGFGRLRIGSQVISAGIRSVDILSPVV